MGMRQGRNARGLIEPVIYYRKVDIMTGKVKIIVAPDNTHPTPEGWERMEARTLPEVDAVTLIINSQDQDHFNELSRKDQTMFLLKRELIKSRLNQRLMAVDCSPMERSLIKSAFARFERKEQELNRMVAKGYFHAREFDSETTERGPSPEKQLPQAKMSERLASVLSR